MNTKNIPHEKVTCTACAGIGRDLGTGITCYVCKGERTEPTAKGRATLAFATELLRTPVETVAAGTLVNFYYVPKRRKYQGCTVVANNEGNFDIVSAEGEVVFTMAPGMKVELQLTPELLATIEQHG